MTAPAAPAAVLALAVALFAAGLFGTSSLHKVRAFAAFGGFVAGYRLLPTVLVRPVAGLLVLLEGMAALALLLPAGPLVLLPAALVLLYGAAMGANVLRGRRDVDCGCGGVPMPLGWALVARNGVLAILFGWAGFHAWEVGTLIPLSAAGLVTAAGAALCSGLLYAAFNQLQANRATHRRLWVASA